MEYVRHLFERGLEVSDAPHAVQGLAGCPDVLAEMASRYSVRLILATAKSEAVWEPEERTRDILLKTDRRPFSTFLDQYCDALINGHTVHAALDAKYELNGIKYHCTNLANTYGDVARYIYGISQTPHSSVGDQIRCIWRYDLYFEFDSLLSKARRSLDRLGTIAWMHYPPPKGRALPNSFKDQLRDLRTSMPSEVFQKLDSFWQSSGRKLKDYRDCAHHFTPLDVLGCSATVKRGTHSAFTVHAPIPDNPSARSRKAFVYKQELDALTYGWETANEVLGLYQALADTRPKESSQGTA